MVPRKRGFLILYHSRYGTTKRYAEWIADELNGDICPASDFGQSMLDGYDTIIIGRALFPGKIKGRNAFAENREALKGRKVVLFSCGIADCAKGETRNSISDRLQKEFPEEIVGAAKVFFLRGGMDYARLTPAHRLMMWMMKKMIAKKGVGERSEEDREFLATYGQRVDFSDRKSIVELVEWCKCKQKGVHP